MADLSDTVRRYRAVCKEHRLAPSRYIAQVFSIIEEAGFMSEETSSESCVLYLAGNNRLVANTDKERLTDNDCAILAQTLANNFYVRQLDLRYNRITDKGAFFLADLLRSNSFIASLNLLCNDIGEAGAVALAEALHVNTALRHLSLSGNKVNKTGGYALAQALQVNEYVESLELADADIDHDVIIAMATVLRYNHSVRSLNLSRPLLRTVQEEPTVHLADMLKFNSTLEELHLEKFQMTDTGLARLVEALQVNTSLLRLNVSCNRLTRDSAKRLRWILELNSSLKELDVSNNRLGSEGALELAASLRTLNTNLEVLSVRFNELDGVGLCALADALRSNVTLQQLFVWGNQMDESACMAFHALLARHRLGPTDTDVQPYFVDGVTCLAEVNRKPRKNFFYAAAFGDDIPPEQQRFADWYWRKLKLAHAGSVRALRP